VSTAEESVAAERNAAGANADVTPGGHQTINRVTRILEEVVYRPGSTFAELTRAVGAPKSSVYGFVRGLLAVDWLFEQDHRLYLGPAFFSLAIASGQVRAGSVTAADLDTLHRETGLATFVGVRAGDHLIYVAEAGSDLLTGFGARSNIRRPLLNSAGGKALLAALPEPELEAFLRKREPGERNEVDEFLGTCASIRSSRIAVNHNRTLGRTAVATVIPGPSGNAIASVTLLGSDSDVVPRLTALSELLLRRVAEWGHRAGAAPRELI
jgi:DNA-binding IclR family transcriptional regulator